MSLRESADRFCLDIVSRFSEIIPDRQEDHAVEAAIGVFEPSIDVEALTDLIAAETCASGERHGV